jgi:hypothetical protein
VTFRSTNPVDGLASIRVSLAQRTRCCPSRRDAPSGTALSFRHGTLPLYAAFNTKTGEVLGKTAARHTSAEFVAFLGDIVVNQPRGKEIHENCR